ncbi:MBL fold metallo-hydrolase [Prochlorococcus marinus]|uniref:MBL fold metallo-hydrolase n=1 Tax=Prochlorococcus marinus TaxID=1219 RepID=UPI0022B5481D|nr:MBL fold metallo-hydrolase [Prochlorococcus marinus]
MVIKATYYGANGWLIELDKTRILIDPWLNGDLTFPPGDWLIKGKLVNEKEIPSDIDYLLLTQGQPDHAHAPTLMKIDKGITVIASLTASKVVSKIGFTKINTLKPGEIFTNNNLKIQATSGASVPNIENGYIIDSGSDSIYIEPHGFLDKKIKPRNIDLLITPVLDFSLPIVGNFINGKTVLPQLLNLFNPSTILASTTGGDISFTGIINNLIKVDGSVEDIDLFKDTSTNLINPEPLKKYEFKRQLKLG